MKEVIKVSKKGKGSKTPQILSMRFVCSPMPQRNVVVCEWPQLASKGPLKTACRHGRGGRARGIFQITIYTSHRGNSYTMNYHVHMVYEWPTWHMNDPLFIIKWSPNGEGVRNFQKSVHMDYGWLLIWSRVRLYCKLWPFSTPTVAFSLSTSLRHLDKIQFFQLVVVFCKKAYYLIIFIWSSF